MSRPPTLEVRLCSHHGVDAEFGAWQGICARKRREVLTLADPSLMKRFLEALSAVCGAPTSAEERLYLLLAWVYTASEDILTWRLSPRTEAASSDDFFAPLRRNSADFFGDWRGKLSRYRSVGYLLGSCSITWGSFLSAVFLAMELQWCSFVDEFMRARSVLPGSPEKKEGKRRKKKRNVRPCDSPRRATAAADWFHHAPRLLEKCTDPAHAAFRVQRTFLTGLESPRCDGRRNLSAPPHNRRGRCEGCGRDGLAQSTCGICGLQMMCPVCLGFPRLPTCALSAREENAGALGE